MFRTPRSIKTRSNALWIFLALVLEACSPAGVKSHYLLAEKLWSDGKYAASVVEFEKVIARDPNGKLGVQALSRAASTQALFLGQYGDAVKKYRAYADRVQDPGLAWDARKQIGEILFNKTEQYDLAALHYESLLAQRADAPEAPEFLFRIARCHFFLWQFDEAVETYQKLIDKFPQDAWAERASFELGVTAFTRGEQKPASGRKGESWGKEAYQEAMDRYAAFIKKYPQSKLVPEAKFGIACCLEELDQLDAASDAYRALKTTYPSKNVIEIKLARIRERKAQRNR